MYDRTTRSVFHDPSRHSWDSNRPRWQRLTNSRPIPDQRHQRRWRVPPRVTARLVWLHDGEEQLGTVATHWARVDGEVVVLVEVLDEPRRKTLGAWLALEDVRPLDSAQQ